MFAMIVAVMILPTEYLSNLIMVTLPWEVNAEDVANSEDDKLVFNGHQYQIFYGASFNEADEYCKSQGGHIATITSQEENDSIYRFICNKGYRNVYFGLTDRKSEGKWDKITEQDCILLETEMNDYTILKDSTKYCLVLEQVQNDFNSILLTSHCNIDEDVWSEPYQINDGKSFLRNSDFALNNDGTVMAAMNKSEILITEDSIEEMNIQLSVENLTGYADLVCDEFLLYDEEQIVPGGTVSFYYTIKNNSAEPIHSYRIILKDEDGNELLNNIVNDNLGLGEQKECRFDYTLPDSLKKRDLYCQ